MRLSPLSLRVIDEDANTWQVLMVAEWSDNFGGCCIAQYRMIIQFGEVSDEIASGRYSSSPIGWLDACLEFYFGMSFQ